MMFLRKSFLEFVSKLQLFASKKGHRRVSFFAGGNGEPEYRARACARAEFESRLQEKPRLGLFL
jgi:hypothetical protein